MMKFINTMWDVMGLMIGEVAIPYDSKEEPMMKTILYTIFIPIEKTCQKDKEFEIFDIYFIIKLDILCCLKLPGKGFLRLLKSTSIMIGSNLWYCSAFFYKQHFQEFIIISVEFL